MYVIPQGVRTAVPRRPSCWPRHRCRSLAYSNVALRCALRRGSGVKFVQFIAVGYVGFDGRAVRRPARLGVCPPCSTTSRRPPSSWHRRRNATRRWPRWRPCCAGSKHREAAPAVAFLTGSMPGGRIGVGWATLANARVDSGDRSDRSPCSRSPTRSPPSPPRRDAGSARDRTAAIVVPARQGDRTRAAAARRHHRWRAPPGRARRRDDLGCRRRRGRAGGVDPAGLDDDRRPAGRGDARAHRRARRARPHRARAESAGPADAGQPVDRRRSRRSPRPGWPRWSGSSTAPGCRRTDRAARSGLFTRNLNDVTDRLPLHRRDRRPHAGWRSRARRRGARRARRRFPAPLPGHDGRLRRALATGARAGGEQSPAGGGVVCGRSSSTSSTSTDRPSTTSRCRSAASCCRRRCPQTIGCRRS